MGDFGLEWLWNLRDKTQLSPVLSNHFVNSQAKSTSTGRVHKKIAALPIVNIVGWGGGGIISFPEVGFMLDKHGKPTTIAFPGAIATRASGINDRGDIVRQYNEIPGFNNLRAFVLNKHGKFDNADYPGSSQSALWGINSRGQAVGEYQVPGEPGHAYIRNHDGSVERFDLPPELLEPGRTLNYTRFKDINDQGDIVGQYSVSGTLILLRSADFF